MSKKAKSFDVTKIMPIRCGKNPDDDFFYKYVLFLRPYHGLTKGEMLVMAAILRARYDMSKKVSDDNIIDQICLNDIGRAKIRESLNMPSDTFNNFMRKLRDAKVISANMRNGHIEYYSVAPSMIPEKPKDGLNLLMCFIEPDEANSTTKRNK